MSVTIFEDDWPPGEFIGMFSVYSGLNIEDFKSRAFKLCFKDRVIWTHRRRKLVLRNSAYSLIITNKNKTKCQVVSLQ